MSDEDFGAYVEYLRATVCSGDSVPDGLGDIVRAIKQKADSGRSQDGNQGRERSRIPKIGAVLPRSQLSTTVLLG